MVMSETLHLTIRYEEGEEGWIVASIPQVPGAMSQGRTREEARANVLDALRLLLSPEPGARGESESPELTIV
jgi:predicted RNase H-like HicB family nuclease